MRIDTDIFTQHNVALSKEPRFVFEVAFDEANTILWYFTSHADAALPGGGGLVSSVVSKFSESSQTLNPDEANANIGTISFDFTDKAGIVTSTLGSQLALGRSTRLQRVRAFMGYKGDAWADYVLLQTQLVWEIAYHQGVYTISCQDIQRALRKDIFEQVTNTLFVPLAASELTVDCLAADGTLNIANAADFPISGSGIIRDVVNDQDVFTWTGKTATTLTGCSGVLAHNKKNAMVCDATVIVSFDNASFEMVPHGVAYSDAPSATVGYIRIEDEIIRYTGKSGGPSPWKFTGCLRGAMNTRAVPHATDTTQTAERRLKVVEYVYLEGPAISLMYQVLTGKDRFGAAALPTGWHLGVPLAYVRLSEFTGIGSDLWDLSNELQGFPARFEDMTKTDGKKFVEQQLALLSGVFMPIHADGAFGCKRMAAPLAGAAPVAVLDESNSVSTDPLRYDFSSLHNIIRIRWNWEPLQGDFTRANLYLDGPSIITHKKGVPLNLEFRGLHGSRHSEPMIRARFDAIRDRYSQPPLRTGTTILGRFNGLEVGDVVRQRMTSIRDFVANGILNRSFEIQNITIDWVKQRVKVALFGSSGPAAPIHAADSGVIPQSYYVSEGTALSAVPGIVITGTNPGRVTTGATLTGASTLAGAIYYYDGDLQLEAPLIFTQNVFLKVNGHLQNNVACEGRGRGLAAGTIGTAGFIGTTEAGGGLAVNPPVFGTVRSNRGTIVTGLNPGMPVYSPAWTGAALTGLPTDLRGSSGSTGNQVTGRGGATAAGGVGGAGGAGLMILCKGFAQGASGSFNLSGSDGSTGGSLTDTGFVFHAGSGAGGANGGMLILLDGFGTAATDLGVTDIILETGATPYTPEWRRAAPTDTLGVVDNYSYFVGIGNEMNQSGDVGGGVKYQYVINTGPPVADLPAATLPQPSSLSLASGTSELLRATDGTIITRVKLTWGAVQDARVAGYDVQFKKSTDTLWQSEPSVLGQGSITTRVSGLQDGVNYDFRVRAASSLREVSEWTEFDSYLVLGKSQPPSNVGTLTFTDPILSWVPVTDDDLAGYVVRYQPSWASTDWPSALPGHTQGFLTPTEFDTVKLVGGQVTMLVKAVDTTGNESVSVSSLQIDLRPPVPTGFTVTRQPDGTRELAWILASPPSDLDGFRIKWFLGSTSDWTAMTLLHTGVLKASPFESNQLAAGTYTFAIKSVDKAGNESATALFITALTIGDPRIAGSIEDFLEEPNWTETKTSCHVDGATGWLVANGSGTWATAPTWAAMDAWVITPAGSIQYERKIDVGLITTFTPLVTVVADSAGGAVTIEEAHSNVDSGYSAFVAVGPELTCRWIKIRVTVTGTFPKLKSERIILSAALIEEVIEDIVPSALTGSYRIGAGNIRLPITKVYSVIKKVDLAFQSITAGDIWTWSLEDKDTSVGPHVKLYKGGVLNDPPKIDATVRGV